MKFIRKHIVPICAIFTLIAVGCYEGYWILRMYNTERESVESIISSSVIGAEVEEYIDRIRTGNSRDTLMLPGVRPGMKPRILSMSSDSLDLT